MRKSNKKFAQRWAGAGSRAPSLSHETANNKTFQVAANDLLKRMFWRFFIVNGFITKKEAA